MGQDRIPLSFTITNSSIDEIPNISLPPIPIPAAALARSAAKSHSYLKRLEFGATVATSISINDQARADTVGSTIIYRIKVTSQGAKCLLLKLTVDKGKSFDSQQVFVYNPTHTFVAYTLTKLTNESTVVLPLVPGDCAILEIEKPTSSKARFTINEVVHGDRLPLKAYDLDNDISQSCNIDLCCPEGKDWQLEKNSIVKILTNTASGVRLCSGVMVNNTAKDKHPYLLTARHCILSEADALNSVFYFGYEKKECGSSSIIQGKTISGAKLIATGFEGKIDFALLELSVAPPLEYQPYFAGWNIRKNPFTQPKATCLHHPNGDVKKISVDNDTPTLGSYSDLDPTSGFAPNTHWHVARWDIGATEGGSSGSALFNNGHQVVGNLTGGISSCEDPVDDYFSSVHAAWSSSNDPKYQLKKWLDPIGSGDSTCTGMLNNTLLVSNPTPCDGDTITLQVIPENANLTITNLRADNTNQVSGVGIHKLVWSTAKLGSNRTITADFTVDGIPTGSFFIAAIKEKPEKPAIDKVGTSLSTPATLLNQWYLNGLPINNSTTQRIEIAEPGKYYVESANEFGCTAKSDIITIEYSDEVDAKNVTVYPVPVSSGVIHIKMQAANSNVYKFFSGTLIVNLYDINGRKLGSNTYTNPTDIADFQLPTTQSGLYLLEMVANGKRVVKKVVISGM